VPSHYFYIYQCKAVCETRTFPETSPLKQCRDCPNGCETCTSSEVCTDCDDGLVLQDYYGDGSYVMCTDGCFAGFYEGLVATVPTCLSCLANCNNCTSNANCIDCEFGFVLETAPHFALDACVAVCDDGYFANELNICEPCSTDCKTCDDPSTCTECDPGSFLILDTKECTGACTPGYYATATPDECNPCPEECTVCSDATTCSACATGFELAGSNCNSMCGNGVR